MPPDPGPTVVVDEDGEPGFSDELERRVDVAAGVTVVRPVPGVTDRRRLAADVLVALGKHYDCLSRERQSRHGWDLARMWARAERLRHLVVWDAQRLPVRLWSDLEAIGAATAGRVWMVVQPDTEAPVRTGGAAPCTPADLLAQIPVPPDGHAAFLDEAVVLPQESFLTFRWACFLTFRWACVQRLRRDQFSQVDKVYLEAHWATRTWLEARRWNDRPDRTEVVGQLRALISQSRASTETVVRLRAAQAAYFRDGVLVQLDDARPLTRPEVPAAGVSAPLAARLRRLVTPAWACALALTMTAGVTVTDLVRLRIGALHDGTLLSIDGQAVEVPAHAAGLVRAQLLTRAEAAAADGDRLFVHAGQALEPARLARHLDNAARLAGVWRPSEERRPRWEPAPVDGFNVRLVPLDGNWEAAASA